MIYDHISVGGGVIGINTTINLLNKLSKCKFKKKIKLCIIDKDINNIPGGVAYGKKTSAHGYFNNPLRLSHLELQKYYSNIKNFLKLKDYLKLYGSDYDNKKFEDDLKTLKTKNIKKIKEIYLPRVAFSYLQENSLAKAIKKILHSNINVQIDFYEGEVSSFSDYQTKKIELSSKKKFNKFNLNYQNLKESKISFLNKNIKINNLYTKNLTIGMGVTPPKKLTGKEFKNESYIWDFYAEGATSYLIKKLQDRLKFQKEVKLCFIGSKAGFLESLQEIYRLRKNNKNLKIFCFSKKFETLQSAKIDFKRKVSLKFLNKNKKNINTAKKLYLEIVKELNLSNNKNDIKYLIWTEILSKNILSYFLKKLDKKELIRYQTIYFQKIRSLTRFTFPETIQVKDTMMKEKMIKNIKEKAQKIFMKKNLIHVMGDKKNYKFDIVVNVTGPTTIHEISEYLPFYKSLLNLTTQMGQVIVNKDFSLKKIKNIFTPGTIAQGFNDQRLTIIRAIIQNSNKSSSKIFKRILS